MFGATAALSLLGTVNFAQASSLNTTQVSAIVSLLQSFGADQTTIANVQASLTGKVTVMPISNPDPIPTPVQSTGSCVELSRNLSLKSQGNDVTQLQQFLGVSPTGYFGSITKLAVMNWQQTHGIPLVGIVGPATRAAMSCGGLSVTGGANSNIQTFNTQPSSVAGMTKYTDTDFGFSFWYPSAWTIQQTTVDAYPGITEGTVLKQLRITGNNQELSIQEFHSPTLSIAVNGGACGSCGPVTYFFNKNTHQWMKKYPMGMSGAPQATREQIDQSKLPIPADVSKNTMGGLHQFSTEQRESATIIPLSAANFLYIKDIAYTKACNANCSSPGMEPKLPFLSNTIVATDPSVATPDTTAQQIIKVQAEAQAYGVTSGLSNPTATIDQGSLSAKTGSVTLNGAASNVELVEVYLVRTDGYAYGSGSLGTDHGATVTNNRWSFTAKALPAGTYTVTISLPDIASGSLPAGATLTVGTVTVTQ